MVVATVGLLDWWADWRVGPRVAWACSMVALKAGCWQKEMDVFTRGGGGEVLVVKLESID